MKAIQPLFPIPLILALLLVELHCTPPLPDTEILPITTERHDEDYFPTDHGETENPENDCNVCHGGFDSFREFTCLTCHSHDPSVTDSLHQGIPGYSYESTACLECHPFAASSNAAIEHPSFPIDPGSTHQDIGCTQCHTGGDDNTYSCTGCHTHRQDLTDPLHEGVGNYEYLSARCYACHSDGTALSRDEHDAFFPITSGDHRRYDCADCHLEATYQSFTCINCHDGEHTCSRMDREHDDVRNYSCEDTRCLSCHPRGKDR